MDKDIAPTELLESVTAALQRISGTVINAFAQVSSNGPSRLTDFLETASNTLQNIDQQVLEQAELNGLLQEALPEEGNASASLPDLTTQFSAFLSGLADMNARLERAHSDIVQIKQSARLKGQQLNTDGSPVVASSHAQLDCLFRDTEHTRAELAEGMKQTSTVQDPEHPGQSLSTGRESDRVAMESADEIEQFVTDDEDLKLALLNNNKGLVNTHFPPRNNNNFILQNNHRSLPSWKSNDQMGVQNTGLSRMRNEVGSDAARYESRLEDQNQAGNTQALGDSYRHVRAEHENEVAIPKGTQDIEISDQQKTYMDSMQGLR